MTEIFFEVVSVIVFILDMFVEITAEFTLMLNILFIILLSFSMTREYMLYMLVRTSLFVLMLAMLVLTAS